MAAVLQSSARPVPLPSLQSILEESQQRAKKERDRLAAESTSLRDLYISECKRLKCKKNSALVQLLPAEPGNFDGMPLLDLSLNCVGRNGIRALYRVLEVAHGLQRILLADNCINNDAARDLLLALTGHPTLSEIDLSSNPISHLSGKLLSEFVPLHPQLTSVGLSDTLINPALVRIILRKAELNRGPTDEVAPAPAAAAKPAASPPSPPPAAPPAATPVAPDAPPAPHPKPSRNPAAMPSPAPGTIAPGSGAATRCPTDGPRGASTPKREPLPADVTVDDDWYGVRLLYNTSLIDGTSGMPDDKEGLPAWHGIHSVYVAVKQEEAEAQAKANLKQAETALTELQQTQAQQQPQQEKPEPGSPSGSPSGLEREETASYAVPEQVVHDMQPLELLCSVAPEKCAAPIRFLISAKSGDASPRHRKEKEHEVKPLQLLYESDGKRSLEIGFLLGEIGVKEEEWKPQSALSILSACPGARPELHFLEALAREAPASANSDTAVTELAALLALVDSAGDSVPDPLRFLSDISSPRPASVIGGQPRTPEGLWYPHLGLLMGASDDHENLQVLQRASTPQGTDKWYAMELVWALASPEMAKPAADESWAALAAVMTIVRTQESKAAAPKTDL